MKKISLTLIIVWCIIGSMILGIMVAGIFWNRMPGILSGTKMDHGKETLLLDEKMPSESIRSVMVDLSSEMCDIFLTDENDINVKHYGRNLPDNRRIQAVASNGTLTVSSVKSYFGVNFFDFDINRSSRVEIYLPKSYKEKLGIDISSGTIEFNGPLTLSDLSIDMSSGVIRGDHEIKADTARIEITSGTIRLNGGLVANDYFIEASSGSVNIGEKLEGSGDIEVTSGTIKLFGVNITQSLDVRVSSGTINIELVEDSGLAFTGDKSSGTISTYFKTINDGGRQTAIIGEEPHKTLNVDVTSGSVKVTRAN